MKILVIHDNRLDSTGLESTIREALPEATLRVAAGELEAIVLAGAEDLDVILVDGAIEEPDACDMCRRIKADDRLRDTPVVVIAPHEPDDRDSKPADCGADGLLRRPLRSEEIREQCAAMAEMKTAARLTRVEDKGVDAPITDDPEHHSDLTLRLTEDWQTTFESIRDVVWILDPDMRIIRSNLATLAAFGFDREEVLGQHCWQVVHGTEEPLPVCPVLRMRQSLQRESTVLQAGGQWVEVTVDPVFDAEHRLAGAVHVVSDITSRRMAEQALAASEAKFRAVFESANVGKSLTALSGELEVNQAFCRMLGYSAEELRGKKWQDLTPEDEIEHTAGYLARLTTGAADSTRFTKRYLCKDGSTIWCDVSVAIRRDDDGTPLHFITTAVDVTKGALAEQSLQETTARYRGLFDSMLSGFALHEIICDESGKPVDYRFLEVNQAFERVTGLAVADIVGKNVRELVPRVQPEWIDRLGAVALTGEPTHFEDYIAHLDRYYEITAYSPRPGQFATIIEDVTARRRVEADVAEQAKRSAVLLELPAVAERMNEMEFIACVLEQVEELTGSTMGFVHFVSEDQHSIDLAAWSAKTAEGCSAAFSNHYPIARAGIWADALRESMPVVVNDYPNHPRKMGLPEGHEQLDRFVCVPVIENGRVMMLAGVGNKESPYTDLDVETLQLVASALWRIVLRRRDMELRKQAEESLRLSERRYRELFENPFTGVAVYEAVDDGSDFVLREFSEAAERLTGRKRVDVLGRRVTEAFPGFADMGLFDVLREVHETGEAQHLPAALYESAEVGRRWYENHVHRLPSGEVVALFEDATVQEESEIELRESRERYALLFDTSNDAVLVHIMNESIPGKFVEVNKVACTRLGYEREELLAMTPSDVDVPEMDNARQQAMEKLATQGQVVFEMVQISKDGRRLPVEISSRLFTYKGDTLALSIARDITERKEAESVREALQAQLLQSQKMESVGRLAGGVAHDFNNMLSIILGYGESIYESLHSGDPLREQVKQILEAGQRSADLTRQLLAFSRKQTLQPEVMSLNEVVARLEKMLRRLIGEHIELRLLLSEDIGHILVDPGQLEQVIMNLVVNARDAMPTGGVLTIKTAQTAFDRRSVAARPGMSPGTYVVLTVTDTGSGMSPEVLGRVFEPFFTTKEMGEGTGLGLSTVYGIVQQSGGSIWVDSELGRGTSFEVCLPQTEAEEKPTRRHPEGKWHAKGGERILVVEDEEALRKLMETLLPRLGYTVTAAANGGEALLLIEEKGLQPDLIITDVVMPNMSGKEFVTRLRRTRAGLKVLYMSGYSDDAIMQHGVLDPDTPFIQKPFSMSDIAAKIRTVLDGAAE